MVLPDEADHAEHVRAWLAKAPPSLTPIDLTALLERALSALWRRSEVTLGEVTLTAIVDRVLYTATETYPALSALEVGTRGISFDQMRERVSAEHIALEYVDLRDAIRFVLTELLTVLGHLTDEILTPALHAELSKVALVGPVNGERVDSGPEGIQS